MGKDVITDRYARLYEIPHQLARLGHTVLGLCLGYRGQSTGTWKHNAEPGYLTWESHSTSPLRALELARYPRHMLARLRDFRPNILIGASDIPHVALTAWLAKRLCVPYAIDLYDNFEGFGQARIPGMVSALRHAVREASLVTTTSEPLSELVRDVYLAKGEVLAMPSTVDKNAFHPLNRLECRRRLGLPLHNKLIGTAGGLYKSKGIETLYTAWNMITAEHPDLHLALAGPLDRKLRPPHHERVHYLGEISHADTARLFNALDVGVIYVRDTTFGRYCFPQKAYEMLACGLPIIASRVGAMAHLLAEVPACLYEPDDAEGLASSLLRQLDKPESPEVSIADWTQVVGKIEPRLRALAKNHSDRLTPQAT